MNEYFSALFFYVCELWHSQEEEKHSRVCKGNESHGEERHPAEENNKERKVTPQLPSQQTAKGKRTEGGGKIHAARRPGVQQALVVMLTVLDPFLLLLEEDSDS